MQLTHSLKAPGFIKPLSLSSEKTWFQAFAFKWVNLYRSSPVKNLNSFRSIARAVRHEAGAVQVRESSCPIA
jgi:Asp-tRNA(Asn)/Glu-tRNA(Gln) amidotransferase B subunit